MIRCVSQRNSPHAINYRLRDDDGCRFRSFGHPVMSAPPATMKVFKYSGEFTIIFNSNPSPPSSPRTHTILWCIGRRASCDFELTGGFFEKGVFVPGDGSGGGGEVKKWVYNWFVLFSGDRSSVHSLSRPRLAIAQLWVWGWTRRCHLNRSKGKPLRVLSVSFSYVCFIFFCIYNQICISGCIFILLGEHNLPQIPSEEKHCLKKSNCVVVTQFGMKTENKKYCKRFPSICRLITRLRPAECWSSI